MPMKRLLLHIENDYDDDEHSLQLYHAIGVLLSLDGLDGTGAGIT